MQPQPNDFVVVRAAGTQAETLVRFVKYLEDVGGQFAGLRRFVGEVKSPDKPVLARRTFFYDSIIQFIPKRPS